MRFFRGSVLVLLGLILLVAPPTSAQQLVDVTVIAPTWDMVSLTDLVDIASLKLKPNVSNLSIILNTNPPNSTVFVYLELKLEWQLSGDAGFSELFTTTTTSFLFTGTKTIGASDLLPGSALNPQTKFNTSQEDRLKSRVQEVTFAPTGSYRFLVTVYQAQTREVVGRGSPTIRRVLTTSESIPITLIDPQDGAVLPTKNPTFSWTTTAQKAELCVVETRGRSAQEAILDPRRHCAIVTGTTYTYPVNATIRLEDGQSYYIVVSPIIASASGEIKGPPIFASFRMIEGATVQLLNTFFASVGGDIESTYRQLKNQGGVSVTLNGRSITLTELRTILNTLTQRGVLGPANQSGFRIEVE